VSILKKKIYIYIHKFILFIIILHNIIYILILIIFINSLMPEVTKIFR